MSALTNSPVPGRPSRPARFFWLGFVTLLIGSAWFMSGPLRFEAFMGDDLTLWQAQRSGEAASGVVQALTESSFGKYRPMTSLLYWGSYKVCAGDPRAYVILNLISLCGMIAAIGTLFVRDFRHKYFFGTALCVILLISRFAYAAVWQRIGIMEEWAFFFFALSVLAALAFYRRGRLSEAVTSLVLFFICGYTHERYLVVGGFLTLIFLLAPSAARKTKLLLAGIPGLIVALNIFVKTQVLHTQFLMGTGGHSIKFDLRTIGSFMGNALANIFGFNNGPDYFAGFDVRRLGHWAWGPGISIAIGFSSIGALFLLRRGRKAFRPALLFASLLLPLLLSASITVDQEFRWLYGPELALIAATFMMTAQLIEEIPGRRVAWGGLGLFLAGTTAIDVIARAHTDPVFFVWSQREADSIADTIVRGFRNQLSLRPIYLVDTVIASGFLTAYFGANPEIIPIPSQSLPILTPKERQDGLFFTRHDTRWEVWAMPASKLLPATGHEPQVATADDIKSIPRLREPLLMSPGSWYYTMQTGLLLEARNPAKAERYLREAIQLVGANNPYPYFYLGQLLQQEGRAKEASVNYEMAMKLDDPSHPNPAFARSASAINPLLNEH